MTEVVDQDQSVEKPVDPISLFSEQIRIPVMGLAFVGYIHKDVTFCGHQFGLRTLRPSEKAAIAVVVRPYQDTLAGNEVWAHAHVGMALTSIDGVTDFCPPIGPNIEEYAKQRLQYVTNAETGWYIPTLAFLYDAYLELETESLSAVKELQNLSYRNPVPSPPSPDSFIEPDILGVPINSIFQP